VVLEADVLVVMGFRGVADACMGRTSTWRLGHGISAAITLPMSTLKAKRGRRRLEMEKIKAS
jgi:hypothetical protein